MSTMHEHRDRVTAPTAGQDFLIPLDPVTGLYILALITTDLRRNARKMPGYWVEDLTSFSLFLRDMLPPEFQLDVPVFHPAAPDSAQKRIA